MASPQPQPTRPDPPDADPVSIRACLPPDLRAQFDRDWDRTLDQAKADRDLQPVHRMLADWRHTAYIDMTYPGGHAGLMAKAETILRTGKNPNAVPIEDMDRIIRERLGE